MRPTTRATVVIAAPRADRAYRTLESGPGEAHRWRTDLVGGRAADELIPSARALLRFAHLTDLHVIDAASPARAEHCQLLGDDPRWAVMLPMHRPNELLNQHAVAAMVATIAADPVAAVSGGPLDLAIVTGDCIDNAQRNELDAFLALLDGGVVHLPYDGVQSPSWPGTGFWCPEPGVDDDWKRTYGFPSFAGLLQSVDRPIVAAGIGIGWLGVVGNHDWMRQGTAPTTAALERIAVADRKAMSMPVGFAPADALQSYLQDPASYSEGAPTRTVRADSGRRAVTRTEFISAHMTSPGGATAGIAGHGFGSGDGTGRDGASPGDYVHDVGEVRIIVLDTNHPAGHYQGSVGRDQLEWLDRRISEASPQWVMLATHHGVESLTNVTPGAVEQGERVLAGAVTSVLHRHANVVAWVSGHRHQHRIVPHPDPAGRTPGFWQITTSAVIDWPSQARTVELLQLADGQLVIACTVVDHLGEITPGDDAARSDAGVPASTVRLRPTPPCGRAQGGSPISKAPPTTAT